MKILTYCILLLVVTFQVSGQKNEGPHLFEGFNDARRGEYSIRIAFYNVENLFDIYDDTLINDEAFLPQGNHYWNTRKYQEKLKHLSKTLVAVGGWEAIEIIGLCEVENLKVLKDLVYHPSLEANNYQILHQDSPDKRGIDVALLYRSDKITIDTVIYITVQLGAKNRPTRDILYAQVRTQNGALLHVFVNHWPSRYGGQMKSEPKRKATAALLHTWVDSILMVNPTSNILVMGDFNDEPKNESIWEVLQCKNDTNFNDSTVLYNLMSEIHGQNGSHKYQGHWGVLDQFMVSKALCKGQENLKLISGPLIFKPPYLLTTDTKYTGSKPFRSYLGFKYIGGYSDHLPIFIDLQLLSP